MSSTKRAATEVGDRLPRIGWWLTGAYLVFLMVMAIASCGELFALKPNEFGDMLSGVFAPLAFFWLVLGFFQQGAELKASVAALELQGDELRNSVEQQRELVKVSREQMESEMAAARQNMKNFKDAQRGVLTGRISNGTRSDTGAIRIPCHVHNVGREKVKVVEATGAWQKRIHKSDELPVRVMSAIWVDAGKYEWVNLFLPSDDDRGDLCEFVGRITYQDQFGDRYDFWVAGLLTGQREPSDEGKIFGDSTTHEIKDMTDAFPAE